MMLLSVMTTHTQPVFPVFSPHSPYARSIYELSKGVLWASAAILALVVGLVTYATHKFRGREGEATPTPTYGNPKFEVSYLLAFVAILGTMLFFALRVMRASDPPAGTAENLQIVAHQFWWEVRYPGTNIVTANEIHVPINVPQRVGFKSADVIHDFWVPELGRKIDIIPGIQNRTWFSAEEPGEYHGRCAEYCGQEHAWMRILVIAQTPQDFAAWEGNQARNALPPQQGDEAVVKGAAGFQQLSCASCHTIRGTAAHARVGPDLTHVASRQTLAAGRLENTPANLKEWLHEPDEVKPGCKMPNLYLTEQEQQELVAYLETLR